jgi:hypothetical protein
MSRAIFATFSKAVRLGIRLALKNETHAAQTVIQIVNFTGGGYVEACKNSEQRQFSIPRRA